MYSLCFNIDVMFGHKLCYEIEFTFDEFLSNFAKQTGPKMLPKTM